MIHNNDGMDDVNFSTTPISSPTVPLLHNKMIQDSPTDDDTTTTTAVATTTTTKKRALSPSPSTNRNNNQEDDNTDETKNHIVNRSKTCRKDKKQSHDAYHMAYHRFRYQSVYFTYHDPVLPVEASSSLKIQYHHHHPQQQQQEEEEKALNIPHFGAKSLENNVTTIAIPPSSPQIPEPPLPGTPLCYYKASYLVKCNDPKDSLLQLETDTHHHHSQRENDDSAIEIVADMIVHQHVNGLCVICVANMESILQQHQQQQLQQSIEVDDGSNTIQFQYQVQVTSSELSLAQKRKRNTKQLQGKKNSTTNTANNNNNTGLVQPSDTLATITFQSKVPSSQSQHNDNASDAVKTTTTIVQLPCCVMGSIIELNEQFMNTSNNHINNDDNDKEPNYSILEHPSHNHKGRPEVLQLLKSDPYLKGYLAIVLPSGPFPPSTTRA
jgi:hypothetical protein